MPSNIVYNFEDIMTEIVEEIEKEEGLSLSADEKMHLIENISQALKEAYPDGISKTMMLTPEFKKGLGACIIADLAMQRNSEIGNDPSKRAKLGLNLAIILKNLEDIPEYELRETFTKLLTLVNQLRPESERLSEDQIKAQVDECMSSKNPKATLEKLIEEDFILRAVLDAEANVAGGATHIPGHVRLGAVQNLHGNLKGFIQQDAVYSATSTLADNILDHANPGVTVQQHIRGAGLGLIDHAVDMVMGHINTPRPGAPK